MFPRLVRFNNTDETYGLVPTTESGKPLSVAISLMVIIGNSCIMGYGGRGRGGGWLYRWTNVALFWPSVVYYAAFPQLVDCLLNERVILSLDKLQWRLNEWMNERKKRMKERKKWEKLSENFRTIHWNCQLTSAEKSSTFSWALTHMGGGGGYHFHGFQHRYYDN